MELSAENYYSKEANLEYMSVSQFKDFAGTYGKSPANLQPCKSWPEIGWRRKLPRCWSAAM